MTHMGNETETRVESRLSSSEEHVGHFGAGATEAWLRWFVRVQTKESDDVSRRVLRL